MTSQKNFQLNNEITGAGTARDIISLVEKNLDDFNMVNCATALHRLGKLRPPVSLVSSEAVTRLLQHTAATLFSNPRQCQTRHLANCLWACAQLGLRDPEFEEQVLEVTRTKLQWFKPQELSNLLWAIAKMKTKTKVGTTTEVFEMNEELASTLDDIAYYVAQAIHEFTPQGISNTCWGLASLSHVNEDLMKTLRSTIQDRFSEFNPQELSNIIWSFAKLRAEVLPILESTKSSLFRNISSFTEQNIANIFWALAKITEDNSTDSNSTIDTIASRLYTEILIRASKFNYQELAMLAWALSVLGTECKDQTSARGAKKLDADDTSSAPGQQLSTKLLELCTKQAPKFSAQQLSIIALAFAKLGARDENFLDVFAASSKDISNCAWAFARLDYGQEDLFKTIMNEAEKRFQDPKTASAFNPQNLSNLLWSVAKAGMKSEDVSGLCDRIAGCMSSQISNFKARDISNSLWALGTLGIYPPNIASELAREGRKKLSEFNSQELLKFLWGVEKCGVSDEELEKAIAGKQKLTYEFPHLDNGTTITLDSQAPGRKLRGTGVAAWEATFVLADWLTRNQFPKSVEQISETLALDKDGKSTLPSQRPEDERCDWSSWKGKQVVEVGAGLGLPSIISGFLGMQTIATDGDEDVISLLSQNIENNTKQFLKSGGGQVSVKKLLWGLPDPAAELGIDRLPDLVMAADVVYGNDVKVWKALVDTLCKLTSSDTLLIVSQVQRYKKGEDKFFELLSEHFEGVKVPQSSLHEEYRKQGPGTCQLRLFRKKTEQSAPMGGSVNEEKVEEEAEPKKAILETPKEEEEGASVKQKERKGKKAGKREKNRKTQEHKTTKEEDTQHKKKHNKTNHQKRKRDDSNEKKTETEKRKKRKHSEKP